VSVCAYRRFQLRPLMRRGRKIRERELRGGGIGRWRGGGLLLVVAGYTNLNTAFFLLFFCIWVFLPPPTNSTWIPDDVFFSSSFFSFFFRSGIDRGTDTLGRFFFLSDPFASVSVGGYWVSAPTRHERDVTIAGRRGKKLKDGQKEHESSTSRRMALTR
jgi:hypothetical protein